MILVLALIEGFRIQSFSLPFFKVEQFYIKLDKKLIVSAKNLTITHATKQKTSYQELLEYTKKIPWLNLLFDSISIENLYFTNNTIHFLYKNDIFYIENNEFSVDSSISEKDGQLFVKIKQANLKDYDIFLQGMLQIDIKKNTYTYDGGFEVAQIRGTTRLYLEGSKLFYRLKTSELASIEPFMEHLNTKVAIEPQINNWVYKNIVAKKYKIENLEGIFDVQTFEYFPKLMRAEAIAKDVSISFHPHVSPALSPHVRLTLEDDTLTFHTEVGFYAGKKLQNPQVYIYNLMSNDTGIIVDLHSNTLLDGAIHSILQAFQIDIPITQTSGANNSHIRLDVDFAPVGIRKAEGTFQFQDANLNLAGLSLHSKNGTVKLDDTQVILENVHMRHTTLFDINTSGVLDTHSKLFEGTTNINDLDLAINDQNLLHVSDKMSKVAFEIGEKSTAISLLDLQTKLSFKKDSADFEVFDIQKIIPYSKILQTLAMQKGSIHVSTKDYENFSANAVIRDIDTPFYRGDKNIRDVNLSVNSDAKTLDLNALNGALQIRSSDTIEVSLHDLDVQQNFSTQGSFEQIPDFTLFANNVNILDANSSSKLKSESFELKKQKDTLAFQSTFEGGKLLFEKGADYIFIDGKNLTSNFIDALVSRQVFQNGSFDIVLDGNGTQNFSGVFFMENTIIKDLRFFNNLMAFINTIPSLMTLKNPQFNEHGYEVKEGFISFKRKENALMIEEIKLKGHSADISGSGIVLLDNSQIDLTLNIATLKSVSNILNNIPIVRNILLDKDGKIFTSVRVKGTLEKPDISTNLLAETIFSPINIIKRTIKLPFTIFR